jgi:hypothetical protein
MGREILTTKENFDHYPAYFCSHCAPQSRSHYRRLLGLTTILIPFYYFDCLNMCHLDCELERQFLGVEERRHRLEVKGEEGS